MPPLRGDAPSRDGLGARSTDSGWLGKASSLSIFPAWRRSAPPDRKMSPHMDMADSETTRPLIMGHRHVVSAGHPLAAAAAMRILTVGGSAIDAGIAAGFALNVLQPDMAALGGVAPIILRSAAANRVTAFAGIGTWPRAASRERLVALGGGQIPPIPYRWVVPAAVDAWLTALERYGSMSAADVMQPAIELASRGIPANYFLRFNLLQAKAMIERHPEPGGDFLPGGHVPDIAEPIRQPALAETLNHLAAAERACGGTREAGIRAARDAFYRGEIAERIDRFSREVGGFLRAEDLRSFAVEEVQPVSVPYRGCEVFACGPWCQGAAVLQMLRIVEGLDLASMDTTARLHVLAEAVKLALVDRNTHYGDPRFVDVPLDRLLSAEHGHLQRGRIRLDRALDLGEPAASGAASPDTTYVCVVDADGNAFSATPSDGTVLVGPHVPGLGFGISDRGHQTSLDHDNPNRFEPGKRPRLTPNPGLVTGAEFVMPYGTPGGEVQTQAMLQFLVNHLDLGMDLQHAIEAPRFATYAVPATESPHPAQPHLLKIEGRIPELIAADLANRGHRVVRWPDFSALAGAVCAVRFDSRTGIVSGGADPRRMAYAIGW